MWIGKIIQRTHQRFQEKSFWGTIVWLLIPINLLEVTLGVGDHGFFYGSIYMEKGVMIVWNKFWTRTRRGKKILQGASMPWMG